MKARVINALFIASVAGNVITLTGAADVLVPEADAKPKVEQSKVDVCVDAADVASVLPILRGAACAAHETDAGLSAGACTISHIESAWIHRVNDQECPSGIGLQSVAAFPGTWAHTE
jgi:hypothetical protein